MTHANSSLLKAILFFAGSFLSAAASTLLQIIEDPKGEYLAESATVISADGKAVAGKATRTGKKGKVAYLRTAEEFIILGDLPGGEILATPTAISPDKSFIVGSSSSARGSEAFGWTRKSGMVGLGDFEGGEFKSSALAVSDEGRVIAGKGVMEGGGSSKRHGDAFIWTRKDGMQPIKNLGTFRDSGSISGISADGKIMIGTGTNAGNRFEAFRIHNSELEGLGSFQTGRDFHSHAVAVTSDGKLIVGTSGKSSRNQTAFQWTEEKGLHRIPNFPLEGNTIAIGVSDNGRILGRWSDQNDQQNFVYDPSEGVIFLRDLIHKEGKKLAEKSSFGVRRFSGISANGKYLVGEGFLNRNGQKRTAGFIFNFEECIDQK